MSVCVSMIASTEMVAKVYGKNYCACMVVNWLPGRVLMEPRETLHIELALEIKIGFLGDDG